MFAIDKRQPFDYTPYCVWSFESFFYGDNAPRFMWSFSSSDGYTPTWKWGLLYGVIMLKIALTQNQFALVDDADFKWLNQFKWYALKSCDTHYACRKAYIDGKKRMIAMHRIILGLTFADGKHTDHIDGDGLNNSRSNLRVCTRQENGFNQRPQRRITSSRFKGVSWIKREERWQAYIKYEGECKFLGYFDDEIDAAKAYDRNAQRLFGEFARLNFSKGESA